MSRNFPVYLNEDGEVVTVISGQSVGTNGQKYNLARGLEQTLEFLSKTGVPLPDGE